MKVKEDNEPTRLTQEPMWHKNLSEGVKKDIDEFTDKWLTNDPEVVSKLPTKVSLYRHVKSVYQLSVGITAFKNYIQERLDVLKRLSG